MRLLLVPGSFVSGCLSHLCHVLFIFLIAEAKYPTCNGIRIKVQVVEVSFDKGLTPRQGDAWQSGKSS